MNKQEKIDQLRAAKDPNYAMGLMAAKLLDQANVIKGPAGPMGPLPQKGLHYFTPQDVNEIVTKVREQVKDGRPGRDSFIAGPKGDPGTPGKNGKDGYSPSIGLIVNEVIGKLPTPKDGVTPNIDDVVKKAVIEVQKIKQKVSIKDIHDLNDLIAFLKLGGFRGGGGGSGGGTGTNYWTLSGNNIYNNNVGNVGIGQTTPTARLHLAAGTNVAGTAPLKFTAGTILAAQEDGVLEYGMGHLYFSTDVGRYQLDQQTGLVPTNVTIATSSTLPATSLLTTRINTTSPTTQTLPTTNVSGTTIIVKNVNTGVVTVSGNIDGATSDVLYSQYETGIYQYAGGGFWDKLN